MFYIIKDGKIISSGNSKIIQDGLISEELSFTEIELEKLNKGCLYKSGKIVETPEYLAEIEKEKLEIIKQEKKTAIEQIATLSDQLNLLASTLDLAITYIEKTDQLIADEPIIIQSRQVLNGIKTILAK